MQQITEMMPAEHDQQSLRPGLMIAGLSCGLDTKDENGLG
jgi:hypothetical protein